MKYHVSGKTQLLCLFVALLVDVRHPADDLALGRPPGEGATVALVPAHPDSGIHNWEYAKHYLCT
jgi:hypothetical protein